MKMMIATLGILLSMLSATANAAFIFGVDSTPGPLVGPGGTGSVTVFVLNDGAAATADVFQVNMQVTANGTSLANLGLGGTATITSLFPTFQQQSNNVANGTYFVGGTTILGPAAAIPNGRTNLFTLPFAVNLAAPLASSFSFNIVDTVAGNPSTSFTLGGNSLLTANSFSANPEYILAVPEPASLGLCAIGLGGLGLVRKFRKRKATLVS